MTQTEEDQTLALVDDEVSGILLSAGTKGTDEAYWYNEAGLPLTVDEGYQLLTDQYVQYTDSLITESGKTYYVKQTKEDIPYGIMVPIPLNYSVMGMSRLTRLMRLRRLILEKKVQSLPLSQSTMAVV